MEGNLPNHQPPASTARAMADHYPDPTRRALCGSRRDRRGKKGRREWVRAPGYRHPPFVTPDLSAPRDPGSGFIRMTQSHEVVV
ncbi:MAG: hypothetical protein ACK8QZ_12955, partial [Anaerolineales bacterium]